MPCVYVRKKKKLFPRSGSSPLFTLENGKSLSYSEFNSEFKLLVEKSKIQGNFATHSLIGEVELPHFSMLGPISLM